MVLFASRARAVQSPEPKERHARAEAASTGFRPAVSQLVASELQVPSMPPSPLPLPPPNTMHPRRVDGALRSGVPSRLVWWLRRRRTLRLSGVTYGTNRAGSDVG